MNQAFYEIILNKKHHIHRHEVNWNLAEEYASKGLAPIERMVDRFERLCKEETPVIYENNGEPIEIANPYANGVNDEGLIPDRVIVMLKDLNGNYYHPMYFEVPNHFN